MLEEMIAARQGNPLDVLSAVERTPLFISAESAKMAESAFVDLDDNDSDKLDSFRCWEASSPDNKKPDGILKVVGSRVLNPETKFYMLTVEQKDGTQIEMPVYKRDYRRCSKEWGKNPASWGACEIKRDGMRFALVPAEQRTISEENI